MPPHLLANESEHLLRLLNLGHGISFVIAKARERNLGAAELGGCVQLFGANAGKFGGEMLLTSLDAHEFRAHSQWVKGGVGGGLLLAGVRVENGGELEIASGGGNAGSADGALVLAMLLYVSSGAVRAESVAAGRKRNWLVHQLHTDRTHHRFNLPPERVGALTALRRHLYPITLALWCLLLSALDVKRPRPFV